MAKKKTNKEDINETMEPVVVFILVVITIIEFLMYGAAVSRGEYISALNAMISLLNFGALLIIITLLWRILKK